MDAILLTLLCCLACCYANIAAENEGKVVHYTTQSFKAEISKSNHFIMFYAPWCAHCKRLMPVWEQLAEMLNDDPDYQITIGKVDCISDDDLCSENDITGYPTLKFFRMGFSDGTKFRGTRDISSLTSFINEQLGTLSPEPNDSEPITINGLTELTESNFNKHIQKGNVFVKFYAPWCGYCQRLAPIWEDLAKSLENDPLVDIARLDCTIHRNICNIMDIRGYPTLLWFENGKMLQKYEGQRTEASMMSFINKMIGNRGNKLVQDEEVDPDSGGMLILNGNTFEQGIARGLSFVKFFAPWCAYCKRLAPTWNELNQKLMPIPNIQLVKVDCTLENSRKLCNEQEVEGFPTLFLYSNGKKIAEYNGSRNIDDLYNFLIKHYHPNDHDEL